MPQHCADGAIGARFDISARGRFPIGGYLVTLAAGGGAGDTFIWDAVTGIAGIGGGDPEAPYDPIARLVLLVAPTVGSSVEMRFAGAGSVTNAVPILYGGIPIYLEGEITHLELENLDLAKTVAVSLWAAWGVWQPGRHAVFTQALGVSWIEV